MQPPNKHSINPQPSASVQDFFIGTGLALVATAVRFALDAWLGPEFVFGVAFLAVVVAALWRGATAALVATAVGLSLASVFFAEPRGHLAVSDSMNSQKLVLSVIASMVIAVMGEANARARRRSREAMLHRQEKEAELKLILKATPFMLSRCSRDLRYLFVSRAYAEMIGRTPEEIAGKPIAEIMEPAAIEIVRPYIECVLQGQSVEYEARVPLPNGQNRIWRVSYVPDYNEQDEVIGWIASSVDITQQKQTEEKVRQAEKRLREQVEELNTLLDVLPAAVWIAHDPDCQEIRGNSFAAELFRLPKDANVSAKEPMVSKLMRHFRDGRELPVSELPMEKAARTGLTQPAEEMDVRMADGKVISISGGAVPLKDAAGKVRGVIAAFSDVTERKQTEGKLREAQKKLERHAAELEQMVEARTAKLRETVHELEGFSYSITHDLRAPLRAMQGFAEFLRDDYGAVLGEQGNDYLRRVMVAANRMDRLICDMLVYSKVLRTEFPLEPVDVDKLLRGMIETYPNLQEPGATVLLEGSLPAVIGNEAALTQCFSNLLDNAVKFVSAGVKPRVTIRAERRGTKVRFWVSDNGIGIEPKHLDTIFGMFERLHKDYAGTGIGLPLVRKAADRMGGAVGVESEPGRGSRLWLELEAA